jgi:hypothetical protein
LHVQSSGFLPCAAREIVADDYYCYLSDFLVGIGRRVPMSKATEKIKEEILALLPPTLFFFVTLSLIAVLRDLMLEGTGIPISTALQVAIAALVMGKAVLLADLLPIVNRFPEKPLIYNVAWKSAIYFLVSLLLHYLERLVDYWKKAGSFIAGNEKLLAEIIWPHFVAIQILVAVLVVNYCILNELITRVGGANVRKMFFESPTAATT